MNTQLGESHNQIFQLSFNRFLRVDFQGSRVTSDGGLLLVRELDERLGLTGLTQDHLVDLFRQSAYNRGEIKVENRTFRLTLLIRR